MPTAPNAAERRTAAQRELATLDLEAARAALEILERPEVATAITELKALHDPSAPGAAGDSVHTQIGYVANVSTNVVGALRRQRDTLESYLNPPAEPEAPAASEGDSEG